MNLSDVGRSVDGEVAHGHASVQPAYRSAYRPPERLTFDQAHLAPVQEFRPGQPSLAQLVAATDAMVATRRELPKLRDDLRVGWFTVASTGPTLDGFYDPAHDPDVVWVSTHVLAARIGFVLRHEVGHVIQFYMFGTVGSEDTCDAYANGDSLAVATIRAFSNAHPTRTAIAARERSTTP